MEVTQFHLVSIIFLYGVFLIEFSSGNATKADYGVCDETIDHAVAEETLKSYLAPYEAYKLLYVETLCAANQSDEGNNTTLVFKIYYDPDNKENEITSEQFVGKFKKRNPMCPALSAITRKEFMKDVLVLKYVLPRLNRYVNNSLNFPTLYYYNLQHGHEAIVTHLNENSGFRDYINKDVPMDENHALVVLKVLANFHAASYVFESKEGPLDTKYEFYKEESESFSTSNLKFLNTAVEGYVDSSATVLESSDVVKKSLKNRKKVVDWIRKMKPGALKTFIKAFKPSPNFRTITHGNAYGSKMTFRYNDKNEPTDVCLSDFSQSKLGTPAVDINFFLFTSVDHDLMAKDELSKLLKQYFETYESVCKKNNLEPLFTLDSLKKEVEEKMLIGWYAVMNFLPGYLGGEAFAPNLEDFNRDGLINFVIDNRSKLLTLMDTNENFANRYIGMYQSLLEYGLIN